MNRKKRIRLMIGTLLAPYTQRPFLDPDPWDQKAQAFQRMNQADSTFLTRREDYRRARNRLFRSMEERVPHDRISELEQMTDLFYPDEAAEAYLRSAGHTRLDGYFLQKLCQIALEFITLRDGRVSLRMWNLEPPDGLFTGLSSLFKAELWSELARTMPPDILIAAYFCASDIRDPEQLANLPDTISLNDMLLSHVQEKGVAETHAHFNACMSYLSVWEAVTDLTALRIVPEESQTMLQRQQVKEFADSQILLIAGFLRLMMAQYLESGCPTDFAEALDPKKDIPDARANVTADLEWHILLHILGPDASGQADPIGHLAAAVRERRAECTRHLRERYGITNEPSLDLLLRGPYRKYRYLHIAPELLLLHTALWHVREYPQHTQFARAFLCYLRMKNQYFTCKMQPAGTSGLTFFRRYFAASTRSLAVRSDTDREQRRLIYHAAFRNLLSCRNLQKLEIKITPRIPAIWDRAPAHIASGEPIRADRSAVAEQLCSIFQAFLDVCDEQEEPARVPALGIVYHFIKEDIRYTPSGRCWLPTAPRDYISMLRDHQTRFVRTLGSLLDEVEYLSEYVVGLDAGSEEIYNEPWIYAPVFRSVRDRHVTLPFQPGGKRRKQNLGFTYHVGEDYHHLLSGLRHIDEVLTYYRYHPGDRIGHGLAMQVDVGEWLRNNEVAAVPIMEHLENMLWLWACCGQGNRELGGILPQLENEIMSQAQKIYANIRGLNPYVLWKAYTRKFEPLQDDFCESMKQMYLQTDSGQSPHPPARQGFCALFRRLNQNGQEEDFIWDIDKLVLTHYCPVYLRHYQKQILVPNPMSHQEVFRIMQEYVQQKVRREGIYVETNPTSNMVIGDVPSLAEYPITALNGRGLSSDDPMAILISINSDDPLIFNTNIENELATVYHILLCRGFGREESLEWMNKIRKAGLESSFIRKRKDAAVQRRELESIIHALRQYFPALTAEERRQKETS